MYLWTDEFMWPVYQGVINVREPAVHVLTKSKKGKWTSFLDYMNYGYYIKFKMQFQSQI